MEIIVEGSTVYNGDCLEVMDKIDKCSVDSVVTDPPYHLTSIVKRYGKEGSAPPKDYNTDGAFARTSKGLWARSGMEVIWTAFRTHGVNVMNC